jgi:hypothetical protein
MTELKIKIMDLIKTGLTKHEILKHIQTLNKKSQLPQFKLDSLYNQCVFEYCEQYGYSVRSMTVQREAI